MRDLGGGVAALSKGIRKGLRDQGELGIEGYRRDEGADGTHLVESVGETSLSSLVRTRAFHLQDPRGDTFGAC